MPRISHEDVVIRRPPRRRAMCFVPAGFQGKIALTRADYGEDSKGTYLVLFSRRNVICHTHEGAGWVAVIRFDDRRRGFWGGYNPRGGEYEVVWDVTRQVLRLTIKLRMTLSILR